MKYVLPQISNEDQLIWEPACRELEQLIRSTRHYHLKNAYKAVEFRNYTILYRISDKITYFSKFQICNLFFLYFMI